MAGVTINSSSSYQKGAYPFPKDDIDPKKKDAGWGKKFCEAIYAAWLNDRCGIPFSSVEEMFELRRYGAGNQDIGKYQKILLSESDAGEQEGYLNINWDIFSVMPKFKHVVRGIFEEQEHAIVATAIDPKSINDKKLIVLKKWFKSRYKDTINQVRSLSGAEPLNEWLPESAEELDLFQTMGGLRLSKEMEIEMALNYTLYISDWQEVKRKMIDDFTDINCAALKDYTDPYTKKAKIRYVDPVNLIMQYSRHWDHRNSEFAGEIIRESISNIRKNTTIEEDELRQLAQFYNGRGANANLSSWSNEDNRLLGGGFQYDDFQIEVADCEWFSVNSTFRTERINARGEEYTYDDEWGKYQDKSNRKTTVAKYKTVYRCKWIIGTDWVYDFGIQYDIPRPGKKEVELSYKFYKLPGRSITSLSVPNLDQIQLTWLKLQNALAMSANAGIAVEYTSLQNMKLGGEKMEPLDILSLRRDTGDLFYKLTTHTGRANVPGGFRPIQELQGGIGNQLQEFVTIFDLNMNFIRDLTGINQIADASNPDPNQSVGGSEMAIAATSKALKPIYSGYIRLKELAARSCSIRIQNIIRNDPASYNVYVPVFGAAGVKLLEYDAENIDADYFIKIQARPTEKRKEVILQAAITAMQPDREGYVGIEFPEFLMVERLLEDGNLKYAEYFLAYRSKKNKERQTKLQRENMQLDAQNAQQTATVKGDEDRKTIIFTTDETIRLETAKADLEDRNKANEHDRDMELKALEMTLKKAQPNNTTNK